jgi:hypothetical protein
MARSASGPELTRLMSHAMSASDARASVRGVEVASRVWLKRTSNHSGTTTKLSSGKFVLPARSRHFARVSGENEARGPNLPSASKAR